MKPKLMFLLFVFSGLLLNGQEINLKSAVVPSGGSSSELRTVNISSWRLGEVHMVVLQQDELIERPAIDWNASSYPNPFKDVLNLDFQTEETGEFTIKVTDISGRQLWLREEKTITPNQVISLDLANLAPAIYLVAIIAKDKKTQMVIKVQKQ